MKKIKKIIFSICFVLAFILTININSYAYEQGENENELINTTNYCNLNNYTFSSDSTNFTQTYTIVDNHTFTINENTSADISNQKYIQFDFSNLNDGKYMFIMLNNYLSHTTNLSTTNSMQITFVNSSGQSVGSGTSNYYSSNIQNFTFTKNSTYNRLRFYLKFADSYSFRNKDISFKMYFYSIDEIDEQVDSALYLKLSLFDYMISSNDNYINIEDYQRLEEIAKSKNPFYFAMNGASVELIDYNSEETILTEIINIAEDQQTISMEDLPTIKNYVRTHENYYYVKFNLNTPVTTNLVLYTNMTLQTQTYLYLEDVKITESNTQNWETGYTFITTNGENYNKIKFNISDMYYNFEFNIGYDGLAYQQGYNTGYDEGESSGYANGSTKGYNNGYNNGYAIGYNKGVTEASDNSLYNMILAIVDTPIHIFKGIFDFNVLGINLTNFVLSLVSILIVVWLLKFFL